jgi:hypothetical protein
MTKHSIPEPPQGLIDKILKRIQREERFLLIRHVAIFSTTLFGSALAFVPASKMLLTDLSRSGFFNFFSLIFSDFSSISVYWKNLALILLETLPAASLALFLAVLLVLLQSIKSLFKDIKIITGDGRLVVN